MRTIISFVAAATMLAVSAASAHAEVKVVTSIKPIHSLVAGVMKGVGTPGLIIEGSTSPHTFSMKPSHAAMLQKADVVFWVGPAIETFLVKPLETLTAKATVVKLLETQGLTKLKVREGDGFEGHDDHGHGDDHGAHKDKDHGAHKEDAHKKKGHGDDHHDDHGKKREAADHGDHEVDAHVWLDPMNAKVLVTAIKNALIKADAANAAIYERNAAAIAKRIDGLVAQATADVTPIRGKGFLVFHDAYQYFEKRFGVKASGSITVSPEVMPGAKRVGELRTKVKSLAVQCVFSEPQFKPKLVATVIEGTPARSGVLDPLGASLKNGPDLYFELIQNMAASLKGCLTKSG
ncbi:MAG: zinc ABC transporter substrate-binding protein [Pseudomonadota bacterium]